jgi:origin recognition complex subunit 5
MTVSVSVNATQRKAIHAHVLSPCVCPEPLFVTGPASTGKTTAVRGVLSDLPAGQVGVYVDCAEFCTSRSIYGAIVQKLGRELQASVSSAGGKKRGRASSAALFWSRAVVTNQSQFATHVGEMLREYPQMKVWIALDNVDRVCSRGADGQVLSVLDHLGESLSLDIGLILVSQMPWSSGIFSSGTARVGKGTREPTIVEYSAFTAADLERICLLSDSFKCKGKNHYKAYFQQFVKSMVPLLSRATNNLMDVQNALRKIWKQYIAPVKAGGSMPTTWQHTVLFNKVKGMVTDIVRDLDVKGRSMEDEGNNDGSNRATVSMGLFAKYIVVASYLASRNKPTTDKAIFDPGYSRGKRVRKNSQALDRQSEQALEMRLRGSHPFPLERMLHIFYYVCEPPRDESVERWTRKMQEVDVLMQVSTLCSMGFLTCLSPETLSQPTYKCNVSDEIAYAVAAELNLTLNNYLKLA